MKRRAARVDSNQTEIVKAFRRLGASVAHTHTLGNGFPDVVVGVRGVNYLVEIKDGSKPPSQRKLTQDEQEFRGAWRGQYVVIESIDDVIQFINQTEKK